MLKIKYIQQYRMIKGRVAPPKCLLHVTNQIEKDQHTLIEQSTHLVLVKHLLTPYSYITSS